MKVYYFKTIGDVEFEKTKRSTNIRITIKPHQGVKVTFPYHVSLTNAFRFVEEKSDWIRKNLERIKTYEPKNTLFLPGIEFKTNEHQLVFIKQPSEEFKIRVGNGLIKVMYSNEQQLVSDTKQQLIRKAINHALKIEAGKILPARVDYLAKKHGLGYSEIRLKNLKSRWGSCSSRNNINLNIHLVRLPCYLMDYVILHELAHTIYKNHGKQFWFFLDKLSGNAKELAREMRNYRTQIY